VTLAGLHRRSLFGVSTTLASKRHASLSTHNSYLASPTSPIVRVAGDEEARDNLSTAVNRTPRRGSDVKSWLATHLLLADRLAKVITSPEHVGKTSRAPRPGNLVILGTALDPRVRVALAVAPSGDTSKITVHDEKSDDGERHFLATHVSYVAWWEKEIAARRVTAG
jgi:hypothetical protein